MHQAAAAHSVERWDDIPFVADFISHFFKACHESGKPDREWPHADAFLRCAKVHLGTDDVELSVFVHIASPLAHSISETALPPYPAAPLRYPHMRHYNHTEPACLPQPATVGRRAPAPRCNTANTKRDYRGSPFRFFHIHCRSVQRRKYQSLRASAFYRKFSSISPLSTSTWMVLAPVPLSTVAL